MITLGKYKADLTNWYNMLGSYSGTNSANFKRPLQMFEAPLIIEELFLALSEGPVNIEAGVLLFENDLGVNEANPWFITQLVNKDDNSIQSFHTHAVEGVWSEPYEIIKDGVDNR